MHTEEYSCSNVNDESTQQNATEQDLLVLLDMPEGAP